MKIKEEDNVEHPTLGMCRFMGWSAGFYVWFVYGTPNEPGHNDVSGQFNHTKTLPNGWEFADDHTEIYENT